MNTFDIMNKKENQTEGDRLPASACSALGVREEDVK